MAATPSCQPITSPRTCRLHRSSPGSAITSRRRVLLRVRLISPVMPFQLVWVSGLVMCPPPVG